MPGTGRKALAAIRAKYTREVPAQAEFGIARGGALGLDECTEEQQQLRALIALGVLNYGLTQAPPGRWGMLYRLPDYSIVFSPLWNRFVLIFPGEREPDKMVNYLVPGPDGSFGLPGLRICARSRNGRTIVCRHLPTGALLEITSLKVREPLSARESLPPDQLRELTGHERQALAELPPMTHDARRLLAALTVRLTTCDAHGRWALGDKRYEPDGPFSLTGLLDGPLTVWGGERHLWGSGETWELIWDCRLNRPSVADVAAALTDPVIGMRGAVADQYRDEVEIRLGTATLTLRPKRS